MIKYIKKYKKTLFIVLPLFFISFLVYLSIYNTELFVSYAFRLFTRGNIKIEKLVFEEGSSYKKGKINLKNVNLFDHEKIKAGEIPKVEIEYNNFKIENINVYKPNIIFVRKNNYYNFAHIFVKINSSDKKEKRKEKKNTWNPILKKINISDANVLYVDKSYTKEIKMRAKNVNSTIEFFRGYSINIDANGNNEKEKYILNFNTLNGRYDFNIIGKNIKIDENILQYAYDSDGEIADVSGDLDIDFRMKPDGYFGKGKLVNGKARYSDLLLPISDVNLNLGFLGEKIKIEGNYLLGEKDKGLFDLEYSKSEGTNIDFKFKDLSYESAAAYKYLNDLDLSLNELNFEKVNVNLKYKDHLKVDIYFNSEKGIHRDKLKLSNIYGDFIYENKEFRLKDVNSNISLDIPKNQINREIITNLKYKDKSGKVEFKLKNSGNLFSDMGIGLDFKVAKDKIIFNMDSKLFNFNGEYNYEKQVLNLNQDNNFRFKYNMKDKSILNLKGFFTVNLEDKKIILDMKKDSDETIDLDGKIKFKEGKKGEIQGKINVKDFVYDLNFKVNDLKFKIKDKLLSISLDGKVKGEKSNYSGNINLKNLNYKDESKKLSLEGIYGEIKILKENKIKLFFDGQTKKINIKDFVFQGLRSSISYSGDAVNILNIENKYLKLTGNYNVKNTLSDFELELKNIDEEFIKIKDYNYNIDNIQCKLYGKIDDLYSEIKINEGEFYIKDNLPLDFSGKINYSNGAIYSEEFKINDNILNFKYYLEKQIGSYTLDIFESNILKNVLGSKVKLIGKVNGNINKKEVSGGFRGTLTNIQYKRERIPLIYLEGDFKNSKINFSQINLQNKDKNNILHSQGYVNLKENNLEFKIPEQKLNIQEIIINNSNLTGDLDVTGKIEGPFDKINYELFALSDKISYKENKIDNLKISIFGDTKDINLKEMVVNYKNRKINMDGNYHIEDKKYNFNLKSLGVDLDFFNIIFNEYGIGNIKGIGKIDLNLSNKEALGNIEVEKFGLDLEKYKIYLSDLSGDVKIEKNKLIINKFLGILNGGTVNIKGNVLRNDSSDGVLNLNSNNILYNLILDGRNISYSFDDYFDLNFNTRIQFLKNRIMGNVTINNGEIKNILKKDLNVLTLIKNFIKEKLMDNVIIEKNEVKSVENENYFSEDLKVNIGFNIDNGIELNVKEATSYISNLRGKIFGQGILQGNLKKLNFLGETNIKDGGFLLNGNEFTIDKALVLFNNRNEYIPDVNPNVVLVTSSIINSKIFEISLSGLSKNLTFKIRSGDTTSVNSLDSLLNGDNLDENRYGNAQLLLTNILGGQISDIVVNPIVEIFKGVFRLPKLRVSSNIIAEQNQNSKEEEETLYGAYLEAEMPLYKDKLFGKVKFNFMGDSNSEKTRESYGLVNYDINVYNKINKNISWGVGAQKLRDDIEVKRREINYYMELKFEKKFDF